jgi:hypothetical protein
LLEFKHPFIICSHKLKLSNLEQLGRTLAVKLNSTIQIENNEGFKITYESPNSNYCTQLKIASTTIIPQLKKGFFKILNPLGVTEIYFGIFDEFGNG